MNLGINRDNHIKFIAPAGVSKCFLRNRSSILGWGNRNHMTLMHRLPIYPIAMIEYNVFSLAKRFEAYETIGGFFEHAKDQAMELTISLRIWGFILELLQIIAELVDGDLNGLIINIMKNKPEENKIFRLIESQLAEAA